jgi:signal transduction histidine kinase
MVEMDVPELLLEVRDLLVPELRKRKVDWEQVDGLGPYRVCAVRNNLKQVFINLCLNALEAMEADQERRLIIRLHTDQESRRVGVDVHNSGPHIPEEVLHHIFEPFFTTKKSGTGLGLSISYDIIRQHQGEILVENVPRGGVTFRVLLPLAPGADDGQEP